MPEAAAATVGASAATLGVCPNSTATRHAGVIRNTESLARVGQVARAVSLHRFRSYTAVTRDQVAKTSDVH